MFDGKEVAKPLACSAIFVDEVYGISKQASSSKVGIGVIRGNAFTAYSEPISEDKLIEIYERTIRLLLEKGYMCEIYHNGGAYDESIAKRIYDRFINDERVTKANRPNNVRDLITIISGYKGVITARLHSLYISYSLKIPAVGLCYTTKHIDFMHMIGNDGFAIKPDNMSPEYIVQRFEDVMRRGYDRTRYTQIKQDVLGGIKDIHDNIVGITYKKEQHMI